MMLELWWRPIPELTSALDSDGAAVYSMLTYGQIIHRIGLGVVLVSREASGEVQTDG